MLTRDTILANFNKTSSAQHNALLLHEAEWFAALNFLSESGHRRHCRLLAVIHQSFSEFGPNSIHIKHETAHNGTMAPMYIEICRKTT